MKKYLTLQLLEGLFWLIVNDYKENYKHETA